MITYTRTHSYTHAHTYVQLALLLGKASVATACLQVVMPHNSQATQIRIGMHTGTCMSGLVGSRLPKFSIYGDSINTASRMEVRMYTHAPHTLRRQHTLQ